MSERSPVNLGNLGKNAGLQPRGDNPIISDEQIHALRSSDPNRSPQGAIRYLLPETFPPVISQPRFPRIKKFLRNLR